MGSQLADDFARDGFVFPLTVFSEDSASALRRQLEEVEAEYAAEHDLRTYFRGYPHQLLPFVADLVCDDRVLDPVSEILGPDILVWNSSFFIKEPGSRDFVSWHQDLHYWGLSSDEEVTAWLALSPVTPESGCMRFLAGSHTAVAEHNDAADTDNMLSRGQAIAVEVDEQKAVDVVLTAGQMSLHHGRTFHASRPNRSQDRRIGLAIRYITPAVRQTRLTRDFAMLARGKDSCGNFNLVPRPEGIFMPGDIQRVCDIHREQNQAFKSLQPTELASGSVG